jgi:hypothetical protein
MIKNFIVLKKMRLIKFTFSITKKLMLKNTILFPYYFYFLRVYSTLK